MATCGRAVGGATLSGSIAYRTLINTIWMYACEHPLSTQIVARYLLGIVGDGQSSTERGNQVLDLQFVLVSSFLSPELIDSALQLDLFQCPRT